MTYPYQPPAQMQPPQLPPSTSNTPWFKRLWFVALVAAVIGIGVGGASASSSSKKAADAKTVTSTLVYTTTATNVQRVQPTVTEVHTVRPTVIRTIATRTHTATVTYTPRPKPAVNDGEYQVGQDINGGTWRTSGGSQCYYEIDNDINGSDIVDNNNFTGHQIIQLNSGQYVQFEGGCDWRHD